MSQRPVLNKRIARLRKLIDRTSIATGFDVVQWLKDRRYAQTTGEANRIILDKRLRSGSHVVGVGSMEIVGADGQPETIEYVERYQPVRYKSELIVLDG